jgi:hypothetical protein
MLHNTAQGQKTTHSPSRSLRSMLQMREAETFNVKG